MYLARRNLLKDKTRMLLSVAGVALAVMLILLLNGFLDGLYRQITSYLDRSPASLVVAQEDVANLLGASSLLPRTTTARVESIRGVEQVVPILSQFVILDLHVKKQPVYLVGYDPDQGGGPWEMASGREPRRKREVVFDRVLAERHGLRIGDSVEVLGQDLTIVGLSNGTTSWMTSFIFVEKKEAEQLLLEPGATSFLLVSTSPGADLQAIIQRVNRQSDVNAVRKSDVAANDLKLFAKVFSMPLKLMVAIAFLVGTIIVGMVIYTITVERQREYGVIKAIGGTNAMLYRIVLVQALGAALLGTALGVLMAYGISEWIMSARPQFVIVLAARKVEWAFAAGLGMAFISALVPARVIAQLAPAEVFRR
jgi:putative ABC transport system permease protein